MSLRERLADAICDNCPAATDCDVGTLPFCDLEFKIATILVAVAEEVERMPEPELDYADLWGSRFHGNKRVVKTTIASIVALLRKEGDT